MQSDDVQQPQSSSPEQAVVNRTVAPFSIIGAGWDQNVRRFIHAHSVSHNAAIGARGNAGFAWSVDIASITVVANFIQYSSIANLVSLRVRFLPTPFSQGGLWTVACALVKASDPAALDTIESVWAHPSAETVHICSLATGGYPNAANVILSHGNWGVSSQLTPKPVLGETPKLIIFGSGMPGLDIPANRPWLRILLELEVRRA